MRKRFRIAVGLVVLGLVAAAAAPARAGGPDELRRAMSRTYIHGVNAELADQVAAGQAAGLVGLLFDDSFPHRDNVVAFLTYVGDETAADGLVAFLANPPVPLAAPEEDRAALLAPHALGHMAKRGIDRALEALLQMTADGASGGVLAGAAARAPHPSRMRDDLLAMAVEGLRLSGRKRAVERLRQLAAGSVVPSPAAGGVRAAARQALRPASSQQQGTPTDDLGGAVAGATDGNGSTHDHGIDYANHVDVTNPMTDARLDQCLDEATLRIGRADFAEDIACCNTLTRSGSGRTFGSPGDGLDVIDTSTEVPTVLSDPTARIKVVRAINYCGGAGTNIIGCGWVGGDGIAVVRRSNLGSEAVLWAHEYGHNIGRSHHPDSRYVMHGIDYGTNHAISPEECNQFHAPASGTRADLTVLGVCAETDGDGVHDLIDNCVSVANFDQLDGDGDGDGDVCEAGCGNGHLDAGEFCDGSQLGGATCASLGFAGGVLGCTAACDYDLSPCSTCGDGIRDAAEECDGADLAGAACFDVGCASGVPRCGADCRLDYGACAACPACDGDGLCEPDENCVDCPDDCLADSGTACGNGVCDTTAGEDCLSCPVDCRGVQSGKPGSRYCCGDGDGVNPRSCEDPTCSDGSWACNTAPVDAMPSCCGDANCSGIENAYNCELDCGAPPQCTARGDSCVSDGECCSGRCRVHRGARSCG